MKSRREIIPTSIQRHLDLPVFMRQYRSPAAAIPHKSIISKASGHRTGRPQLKPPSTSWPKTAHFLKVFFFNYWKNSTCSAILPPKSRVKCERFFPKVKRGTRWIYPFGQALKTDPAPAYRRHLGKPLLLFCQQVNGCCL